eukprot:1012865-Amphidinium_carterae.1
MKITGKHRRTVGTERLHNNGELSSQTQCKHGEDYHSWCVCARARMCDANPEEMIFRAGTEQSDRSTKASSGHSAVEQMHSCEVVADWLQHLRDECLT